jgi:NADH dehydrogenase (ubiquinone) Fe-S protein 5
MMQCYARADAPQECKLQAEDYVECLHHRKEVREFPGALIRDQRVQIARANAVKAEFIKQAEHQATEGRKAADVLAEGVVVGVGLIRRDEGSTTS